MAKISKTVVDKALREKAFGFLFSTGNAEQDAELAHYFHKVNDRQYGVILTDMNGVKRYVRIGALVAEEREDRIETYQEKQKAKEERAQKRAAKAEKDKAERKAKAEAKEEGEAV